MTQSKTHSFVLVLDLGTTHIKALAIDSNLQVFKEEIGRINTQGNSSLFREQDPDEIQKISERVIRTLCDSVQIKSIKAIVFSNAMHSIIPVNDKGNPLNHAMIWSDLRAKEISDSIKDTEIGNILYQETGTPVHPMSPLFKIMWIKEHRPELFNETHKYLSIKEYLLFKWFGSFKTDFSTASASGLFNIIDLGWSTLALELAGISPEKLPDHSSVYEEFKVGESNFFTSLEIEKNTPILIGATDGCLAAIGGGKSVRSELSLSIGTSGAIRTIRNEPLYDPKGRIFNYYLDKDIYVVGGPSNNGGNLLDWYGKNFFEDFNRKNSATKWTEIIKTSPTGSDGLLFLPYIYGERAPLWEAGATGSFVGIRGGHNSNHFARSVLEGVIMNLKAIASLLEINKFNQLIISGGAFNIPGLSQLVSDIFDLPVKMLPTINLSAVGAAIIGWEYLGQSINESTIEPIEYLPQTENAKLYSSHFSKFTELLKQPFNLT